MMNKKGFLARDYVIALILFSGVIALAFIMVSSQASDYGNTDIIDEELQENYDNLEQTTEIASEAFEATGEKEGLTFAGSFDILFSSAFTVIALVFNSVGIVTNYFLSIGQDFGIPTRVSQVLFGTLIAVLMTILVFVIISTTTRRDL